MAAPAQTDLPIEVDTDLDDLDSGYGDTVTTFTKSLTSSVLNYPFEYGRRYHAYRPGSYPLPNDESEMDRLDITHCMMVKGIGEKLYLTPLEKDKVHRILDIGTGTGIWAIVMGDEFPHASIIGNDLSAVQPTWFPPNVKFEIDDVESSWLYREKFDFIFCRYMTASISNWPALIRNVYRNLSLGGWAEFQDLDWQCYSEDGSFTEDSSTYRWITGLADASRMMGRDPNPGPALEGWIMDAGFQNVKHQKFKFPVGPWPKDRRLKELGLWNMMQILEGLEAFSLRLYCDVLSWTKADVLDLLENVRKELLNGKLHCQIDFHVVYGQKLD